MHITLIAGARPNFMKIAALVHAIERFNELTNERVSELGSEGVSELKRIEYSLVHTGQHYDKNMSDTFFEELGIPAPDVNLGCGGGSQAEQTAAIMVAFEKYLIEHPTDVVVVVGDVTSTMACSIVAKKLNTKVCHVEAGIRSWDLTMPEINRMVTDSLADYMFTTSDVLNVALFGMTAKEWRDAHPDDKGNIRDYATINQLICLSNMENLNAVFINEGLEQPERLQKLNQIAIQQMTVLENAGQRNVLKA